jgi:hypothetical protein
MKPPVVYELRLPKSVKIDSVNIKSIPIDESWIVAVRENHTTISETAIRNARRARY